MYLLCQKLPFHPQTDLGFSCQFNVFQGQLNINFLVSEIHAGAILHVLLIDELLKYCIQAIESATVFILGSTSCLEHHSCFTRLSTPCAFIIRAGRRQ